MSTWNGSALDWLHQNCEPQWVELQKHASDTRAWLAKANGLDLFVKGSTIDQKTIVFNLGRYAMLTLPDLVEPLAEVLGHATYPSKSGRYPSVSGYAEALRLEIDNALAAKFQ